MNTVKSNVSGVKFCDLAARASAHRLEYLKAFTRVLDSGWFILGREVAAFEEEFARSVGSEHAIGVANGTDAIELSLRALGIGKGDAVVTVANTAVATVAAIERTGAWPVLADIDSMTFTLDPTSLASLLAAPPHDVAIKAVVPVHLFGQMADMAAITGVARQYGVRVVEDCAQAHGAKRDGTAAGLSADLAAFSFYPTKNLGAFGDGGMIVAKDGDTCCRLQQLRQYGWKKRFVSEVPGVNSRLDEIQAAMLRIGLKYLGESNRCRRAIAECYDQALRDVPEIAAPHNTAGEGHVYHLYVVTTTRRDELAGYLSERGIETAIHYPVPIHLQPAYCGRILLPPDGLPATEKVCAQILSLPLYPEMPAADIERVCCVLRQYSERG